MPASNGAGMDGRFGPAGKQRRKKVDMYIKSNDEAKDLIIKIIMFGPRNADLEYNEESKEYILSYSRYSDDETISINSNKGSIIGNILKTLPYVPVKVKTTFSGEDKTFTFYQYFMQRPDFKKINFRHDGEYTYKLNKTQFSAKSPFDVAVILAGGDSVSNWLKSDFVSAGYVC